MQNVYNTTIDGVEGPVDTPKNYNKMKLLLKPVQKQDHKLFFITFIFQLKYSKEFILCASIIHPEHILKDTYTLLDENLFYYFEEKKK